MGFNTLFVLLTLSLLCLALTQTTYEDCCFKYVRKMTPGTQRRAVEYRRQVPDGGCNIPAVIFTMKRGREFCTDPRERWVEELTKKIDEKRARNGHKKPNKHRRPYKG